MLLPQRVTRHIYSGMTLKDYLEVTELKFSSYFTPSQLVQNFSYSSGSTRALLSLEIGLQTVTYWPHRSVDSVLEGLIEEREAQFSPPAARVLKKQHHCGP